MGQSVEMGTIHAGDFMVSFYFYFLFFIHFASLSKLLTFVIFSFLKPEIIRGVFVPTSV